MTYTSITIVVSPYHVGAYDHRVGGGPLRILSHGIERDLSKLAPVSFINIGPVDDFEGEIGKTFEIIRRISNAVATAVKNKSFPLVLSGNCYASTGTIAGLNQQNSGGDKPAALWLDAHDDLDTPSTHENGYLDAMAASMMTGTSWHTLMKTVPGHEPLDVKRVVWCGLRDCSELQIKTVKEAGVDVVWGKADQKVDFTAGLAAVLDRRDDIKDAHIHLDLDVLDQSLGRVNEFPSPGGFFPEDLAGLMQMIPQKVNPTSLVVCSFNPRLEGGDTVARLACQAILQLVGALQENGIINDSVPYLLGHELSNMILAVDNSDGRRVHDHETLVDTAMSGTGAPISGFSLIWPLSVACSAAPVRATQKEWMQRQLQLLAHHDEPITSNIQPGKPNEFRFDCV